MRKLIWEDKTYILNERDYAQLLRRFDVSKIKDGFIQAKCICVYYHYHPPCLKCPLYSCSWLADQILGELKDSIYLLNNTRVEINRLTEGKQAITKIRDWLLSAERVK